MRKNLRLLLQVFIFNIFAMEDRLGEDNSDDRVKTIKECFKVGDCFLTPIDKSHGNIEQFNQIYQRFASSKHCCKFNHNSILQAIDEMKLQKDFKSIEPWFSLYLAEIGDKKVAVHFSACSNIVDQKNPFAKQIEAEYVKIGVGSYNKNGIYKSYDSTWGRILPIVPEDNIDDNTASKFVEVFVRLGGYFAENGFITHNNKIVSGLSFYLDPNDRLVQILQSKGFKMVAPKGVAKDSWLFCNDAIKRVMLYNMFE
jgi:hypothetical protein